MIDLSYRAALTRSFLREFRKLPKGAKNRITRAVDEIVVSPFLGIELRGELEGRRRWRVGKYRIIYMIDEKPRLVVFLDVGLRKAIYE